MRRIEVGLKHTEIFQKIPRKFASSYHIILPKEDIGKKFKIIIGNSEIIGEKLFLDFWDCEILERKARKFGTSCHILIPKEFAKRKLKILFRD